ncbi:MAG: methyltransferase domain-containing protein [Saprospiraceae bacterium]
MENKDKLCPKCGSLSRTRRLWNIIENEIEGKKILHFSPSNCIKKKLELNFNADYITTDYSGEFNASKRLDIESIDEPNDEYDLIICYHILEHIENDIKAMKELLRILKPKGKCIIQTPFKSGKIYENDAIKTEEERLIHFGQVDHLRVYSVDGLIGRLNSVGFNTKLNEYKEIENNTNGYNLIEKIIIGKKSKSQIK